MKLGEAIKDILKSLELVDDDDPPTGIVLHYRPLMVVLSAAQRQLAKANGISIECATCEYSELETYENPCVDCSLSYENWTPKEGA